MGVCDIIPGISGGTIAFITGIYERLISGVTQYTPRNVLALCFADTRKTAWKRLDVLFFVQLLLGIGIAVFAGSYVVPYLLEHYFVSTMSFFVGLIFASGLSISRHVKSTSLSQRLFLPLGLIVGVGLLYIVPASITPGLLYVFFSGFVAICAMFLPGVSGSYILLLLGSYEAVLAGLRSTNVAVVGLFLLGALGGALTISRCIIWLLKHYRSQTLLFLVGLVIGSLAVPLKQMVAQGIATQWISSVVLFFLGLLCVFLVERRNA